MWSILWKCTNLVLGLEYVKVGKESKEEAPGALRGWLVSQEGLAWAPGWPRVARALVLDKEFPSPFAENSLYREPQSEEGSWPGQPFSRCSHDGQASRGPLGLVHREGHWIWSNKRSSLLLKWIFLCLYYLLILILY